MAESYENRLKELIEAHEWFLSVLRAVRSCDPPDWLVGGGVLRNLVWDALHGYEHPTALRDVD
ncbi:MAG: nucleotidyltransferase family protein, partial [Bacilli bacterium]